jgi:hypothetical protein
MISRRFEALDGDKIAYGAPGGCAPHPGFAMKLDLLAREQDSARRSVLKQGTRAKLAELAIESAALDSRRLNERKELIEIIERTLAGSASST